MIVPTCRDLIGFLDDYVARRLPLTKRLAFEVHLAMCRDCRRYLHSYRQTMALVKDAGRVEEDPPPMPDDLVKAILGAMNPADPREGPDKPG